MSTGQVNAFLRAVAADAQLQARLRTSGACEATEMANQLGFDVVVADLIRYQARATSWRLSDDELAVVADWQAHDQPFWWQHVWPSNSLQ